MKYGTTRWFSWLAACLLLTECALHAAPVFATNTLEFAESRQWVESKFLGKTVVATSEPSLQVLANHDPVQKNSRNGKPLRLADGPHERGLYCHAFSQVLVRLPGPGKTFTALAGVDSNEQTSGGRGSVSFSVSAGGVEKFRSGVLREGMPPKAVAAELGGATEFTLQANPTPDGIACDQADWAEAKITLQDGREIWLADLPILEGAREPYSTEPPFSFQYDGKASATFLSRWESARSTEKLDALRTRHTVRWFDRNTGLEVRYIGVAYQDYPTVEWTVYFKNLGAQDTPILSNLQALDTVFKRGGTRELSLHHSKGTFVRADDFEPLVTAIQPGHPLRFAPPSGRPLEQVFPYFNLAWQPNDGVIAAIGWPGQWAATFDLDSASGLKVVSGQETTHLRLKAGEEIRTPLVVLQFWRGDWIQAQNVWRRWMFDHNLPRPLAPEMAACSSHQFAEMINASESNQVLFVDRYLEEKLPLDYWWMDAGWYPHDGKDWPHTGNWEVDKTRFPRGLRAITDHARARHVKSIVWFEPERVATGTWLYTNNPAWLLGPDGDQKLLNLGQAEALNWVINHVDRMITEEGIDLYRQDYNISPLPYWKSADAPDRQGVTENHYVCGYLAYWDELRRRHPGMLIDTCASGGHRNDLETLRRSVPLLRSDYLMEPMSQQSHTYGLALWIPFYGTGTSAMDSYSFRSQMCPHFTACFDMRRTDLPYGEARRLLNQWKFEIAPNYFGDYYPLTPYSNGQEVWMAWQFHRPEQNTGVVQAFRRTDSFYEAARLKLKGLDPAARYQVTDLDDANSPGREYTGATLMDEGLLVTATERPSAKVLTYKKTGKN
jgi:alpha-galactosidase